MKDIKTKERFVELRAQGWSYEKIAVELKITKTTAISWAKELQIQIHNLKSIEMDALYKKYFMTARDRVEVFGEQLISIRNELKKRSLEAVSTDKLFDLLMKLTTTMTQNRYSLEIKSAKDWSNEAFPEEIVGQELP